MALDRLNTDLHYVSKLDDQPNDVGGMSATQLKEVFDRAAAEIQDYINNILIPQIEADIGAGTTGNIDGSKIVNYTITAAKIASKAVTSAKINDGAVTEEKIGNGAVSTDKLASSAVTDAKIASGAVVAAKIASKAVTTAKINDSAVTEAKIGDGAVNLASKVSGVLPVTRGGTGAATASAALANLGISYGTGDPPTKAVAGQIYFKKVT